ncbi:MAG: malto-oligosyltrehalose trehalohydrolase [Gammaproteobacteria bacterium]|nr:malto-oligosyltrehalose trehalohydrolase [Gammaproteobacteria bacterium]MBU1409817.1 malto-oligosyltrehalose trehalohydrolase [Gammaproteobacteria bacterium]
MPFGAQLTPQGVRFRVWAPGCDAVGLCIEDAQHAPALPMAPCGDGWFERVVAQARAGTRYRFEMNGGLRVPDPASRFNPDDVHGASEVIDAAAFDWQDVNWRGRRWDEAVVYELHVGTFSAAGTFDGVTERLDYLVGLGVTAIELMPVADFPGARSWGYDGVLPFAPDSRYGRPEELKRLVQTAHAKGLMVLLDVVYNHFGPEGNYLHVYAKPFFSERHHTPWGAAINFDGPGSRTVREFFIHNALYWLEEYRFDGLRLDAVHAILDDSEPHILTELAERVHAFMDPERRVHLVLENDANEARYLGHGHYAAQWNDDIHHALHVLCSGETDGYYADYADAPLRHLGRCLAEGFAYQGEASLYRNRTARGEPSTQLAPQAFVTFLQCHDQVGNRAFGERIGHIAPAPAVRAAAAVYLLAPGIPMLFMGEEFAAATPFRFFCDFGDDLREAVTQGRRREFEKFTRFADPAAQAAIPDPNRVETFLASRLDWDSLRDGAHADWLAYYRQLLQLRREVIVPRLPGTGGHAAAFEVSAAGGLRVEWRLGDGSTLRLLANVSGDPIGATAPSGTLVFATPAANAGPGRLAPWSVVWTLDDRDAGP